MEISEEDAEKTQLLFHFDLPLIISAISNTINQPIDPISHNFQQTFITFQKTSQIPLFETPESLLSSESIKGLEKLMNSQGYFDVELIGKGGFGLVFKAKNSKRNEIVALKLQISFKNSMDFQEEANLGKFLSKKVAENFKSKTLSIYTKIVIKEPNDLFLLTIIEMELAKYSLRELIREKRTDSSGFSPKELKKICFDLLENLYYIHINNIAHFDIKPENVLFISTNESYILADFGISEEIPILKSSFLSNLKGTAQYMSPKLRNSWSKGEKICEHDPFKSDIYSMGLIFLELNTVNRLSEEEFVNLLRNREKIEEIYEKFPLFLNYHYMFYEEEFFKFPNILQIMLHENEKIRKDILEICLILDLQEPILSQILTPFSQRFLPNISIPSQNFQEILGYSNPKDFQAHCIQILYSSRPVVYIGEFSKETIENHEVYHKEGMGILMKFEGNFGEITKENYQKKLIYEGYWKSEIPDKCGMLRFNDTGTTYTGDFSKGRLNGSGKLTIRGRFLDNCQYFENLSEEFKYSLLVDFFTNIKFGVYKYKIRENKVFLKVKNGLKNRIVFDLISLGNEIGFIISLLEALGNRMKFNRVKMKEKCEDLCISSQIYDMLTFYGKDTLLQKNVEFRLLLRNNPIKTQIKSNKSSGIHDILRCALMNSVKTFDFPDNSFENSQYFDILSSKNSQNLTNFSFSHNEKISSLLFSNNFSFFPHILSLNLSQTKINDEVLHQISSKSGLKIIEILNLSLCRNISNEGIKHIMSSPGFKSLRVFNLDSCLITDESLEYYAKSPFMKNLIDLNLCHCSKLMDNSIRNIALSENSKSLVKLNLRYLHITDISITSLINSRNLGNLQKLDIMKCGKFTIEAIIRLLSANIAKKLRILKVGKSKINEKISRKLKEIRDLEKLTMKKCWKITDNFLQDFIDRKQLFLKKLDLSFTKITDISFEFLANPNSSLKSLESLKVSGCLGLKNEGIIKYFSSGNAQNLRNLNISSTEIGDIFLIFFSNYTEKTDLKSLNMSNCKRISSKILANFLSSNLAKNLQILIIENLEKFEFPTNFISNSLRTLDLKGCKSLNFDDFQPFLQFFNEKNEKTDEKALKLDLRDIEFSKKDLFSFKKAVFSSINLKIGSSNISKSCNSLLNSLNLVEKPEENKEKTPKFVDKVTDETLKSFANSLCLKNLVELNLSNCNKITDNGFSLIMNSSNCKNLEKIDLSGTILSDLALNSLISSKSANFLQILLLNNNENMTFNGLISLINSLKFHKLSKFDARIKIKPGDFVMISLFFLLLQKLINLKEIFLDFSFVKIWEIPDVFAMAINIGNLSEISEFYVSFCGCRLSEEILIEIFRNIEKMDKLIALKLDFSGIFLKEKGCEVIIKSLLSLRNIVKIEIILKKYHFFMCFWVF